MADSLVTITAGSGTNIDTRTNAAGEHRQVMVLGNDGDVVTGLEPFGALTVNNGYATFFYDSWSVSPIDTSDKWTVSSGASPAIANGMMTMSATVSTYNAIRSKDLIRSTVGFNLCRNGITLETTAAVGAGRFWGFGTPATTPAPAVLVQDGIGFEVDQATGAVYAVTYAAGARTIVATLPGGGGAPTGTGANSNAVVPNLRDGNNHAYGVYYRVTQAYWFVDNTQVAVATQSFPNVQVAELPSLIVRQNAASFTGTPVFNNIAHLIADTARQSTVLADPVIGARQARVKAPSTAAAAADNALVVAMHPTSPVPPGSNTIGAVTGPAAAALALDGTDITTPTAMPAGGLGIRGWLSAIWTKLNGSLTVAQATAANLNATVSGTVTANAGTGTLAVSMATNTPDVTDRAARLLGVLSTGANTIGAVNIAASQTVAVTQATAASLNATVVQATAANLNTTSTLAAGTSSGNLVIGTVLERASDLAISTTGASGAAVTATLPAPAAGLFQYITSIEIQRYAAAALTAGAAPIVVTTTNLPGSLAWSFDTAGALGVSQVQQFAFVQPLKASVAATQTTFVAPLTTGVIWRINITYYTAA